MNHPEDFKSFSIRSPAASVAGLRRLKTAGDCLAPILAPGDVVFVDEGDTTPQRDDIVLFDWRQDDTDAWNSSDRKLDWVRKFGYADFTRGLKLYWEAPFSDSPDKTLRLLVANDGIVPVKDRRILGRVVAVERNGKLLNGDIIHRETVPVAQLAANAATSIVNLAFAGPVSVVVVSSSGAAYEYVPVTSITVPSYTYAVTVVLTVTGVGSCQFNGLNSALSVTLTNTGGVVFTNSQYTTSAGSNVVVVTQNTSSADTVVHSNSFAIEQSYTVPPGVVSSYYLWGLCATNPGVTTTGNVYGVNIKAEIIKK